MKIRVISLDGGRPKFSQFLLRWVFRIVDFLIVEPGIVALVAVIFSNKGQRLGDLVAGTVLIRTEPRTKSNKVAYVSTDDNYVPVFQQAIGLTDKDIALIHEVITNYTRTGNSVLVYELAEKAKQHLNINVPQEMNSMQFLQTLLRDYSHITTHVADMAI